MKRFLIGAAASAIVFATSAIPAFAQAATANTNVTGSGTDTTVATLVFGECVGKDDVDSVWGVSTLSGSTVGGNLLRFSGCEPILGSR